MADQPVKRKRGRPPKVKTEETKQTTTEDPPPRSAPPQVDIFSEMKADFMSEGLSQQSQLIMRKVAQTPGKPHSIDPKQMFKLMTQAAKELLFNDIEVVAWVMFLEKLDWALNETPIEDFLMFSAFAAKKHTNKDIAPIAGYIFSQRTGFLERYEKWLAEHEGLLVIPPKTFNSRFKELNQPIDLKPEAKSMNYNSCVSDILTKKPKTSSDDFKNLVQNDEGVLNAYKAYKNESLVLVEKTEEEVPTELFEELDSIELQDTGHSDPVVYISEEVLNRLKSLASINRM